MIIAHGSGGVGQREKTWASFFRKQGIATFVIDYFGPRGVTRSSKSLPSPSFDITDALNLLLSHPRIDPDRIGVIGFSRGAMLALTSANFETKGHSLAAHVGFYPLCGTIRFEATGSQAPILIVIGSEDVASQPTQCPAMKRQGVGVGRDVEVIIYEGAYHGFDGHWYGSWRSPNGRVYVSRPDLQLRNKSQKRVMEFLRVAFAAERRTRKRDDVIEKSPNRIVLRKLEHVQILYDKAGAHCATYGKKSSPGQVDRINNIYEFVCF